MLLKTIEIKNNTGIIDIIGDDFDCAVYIKNKPVAINWCDCEGSIGQYLLHIGMDCSEIENQLKSIQYYIREGVVNDNAIDIISEAFRNIFTNGAYEIWHQKDIEIIDIINTKINEIDQYYPMAGTFVALQKMNTLNQERVEYYKQNISQETQPIIIALATAKNDNISFIVDGHHKAKAYQELKKSAQVIIFKKIGTQKIEQDQGYEIIKRYNINAANQYMYKKSIKY